MLRRAWNIGISMTTLVEYSTYITQQIFLRHSLRFFGQKFDLNKHIVDLTGCGAVQCGHKRSKTIQIWPHVKNWFSHSKIFCIGNHFVSELSNTLLSFWFMHKSSQLQSKLMVQTLKIAEIETIWHHQFLTFPIYYDMQHCWCMNARVMKWNRYFKWNQK